MAEDREEVLAIIDEMNIQEVTEVVRQEGIAVGPDDAGLPRLQALLRHHMCGVPLPAAHSIHTRQNSPSAAQPMAPPDAPARAAIASLLPPADVVSCSWLKKENHGLLSENKRLKDQVQQLCDGGGEVDVDGLRRKLAAAREEAAELAALRGGAGSAEAAEQLAMWQQRCEARDRDNARLIEQLAELRAEQNRLTAQLADATMQVTRTVGRKNAAVAGLKTEIAALKSELQRASTALATSQSQALQRQVFSQEKEGAQGAAVQSLQTRLEAAEREVADKTTAHRAMVGQLASLKAEVQSSEEARKMAEAALRRAQAALSEAESTNDQRTHGLSDRALQAERQLSAAAVTWGERCRVAEAAAKEANAARLLAEERAIVSATAASAEAGRLGGLGASATEELSKLRVRLGAAGEEVNSYRLRTAELEVELRRRQVRHH